MRCFLCNNEMIDYFETDFFLDWINEKYKYIKCVNCGLVVSDTVYRMSQEEWEGINVKQHSYINNGVDEGDPKWLQRTTNQAEMFADLFFRGVFTLQMRCVDYACGAGKISEIFDECVRGKNPELENKLLKYEKYTNFNENLSYLREDEMREKSFDVITSSSVFEHLAGKNQVDKILKMLKENGTFCVQTLVCEEVPCDPSWFYLQPVHCTLWTNKAMDYFFQEYGFVGCAYNLKAQMWIMFRDKDVFYRAESEYDSEEFKGTWFFSEKFIDLYKNKPYR